MRGTLHLLSSDDLSIYVAALKTKLTSSKQWLQKNHGISSSEVDLVISQIERALKKKTLTREELAQTLEQTTKLSEQAKKALRSGWGILLSPAAYRGALAFGASLGSKVTFIKPVSRGPRKQLTETEAFRELFRRFLATYGPATIRDFGHWWGNLPEDGKIALEAETGDLEDVEVDGFRGMMIKSDAKKASEIDLAEVVRLVPSFDCYVMHYSPRGWFVPSAHRERIFRKLAGWNYPSVIVDGTAAGIWGLKKKGGKIQVDVELFRKLDAQDRAGIEEEVSRIGEFLESSTDVRYVPALMR
jgi:hypothetical protein